MKQLGLCYIDSTGQFERRQTLRHSATVTSKINNKNQRRSLSHVSTTFPIRISNCKNWPTGAARKCRGCPWWSCPTRSSRLQKLDFIWKKKRRKCSCGKPGRSEYHDIFKALSTSAMCSYIQRHYGYKKLTHDHSFTSGIYLPIACFAYPYCTRHISQEDSSFINRYYSPLITLPLHSFTYEMTLLMYTCTWPVWCELSNTTDSYRGEGYRSVKF